jgi:hypothetical protein
MRFLVNFLEKLLKNDQGGTYSFHSPMGYLENSLFAETRNCND